MTLKNIKSSFSTYIVFLLLFLGITGCGPYSFSGVSISQGIETFQVNRFQNNALLVEPGLELLFTQSLQDLVQNQTNLSLTNSGGDLVYEGEITEYRISPMTAQANSTAAQNRLTIAVRVRFFDQTNSDENLEQTFSFFYDYPASAQLVGAQKATAIDEIFDRLTQDIFNATLAKW